MKNSENPEMLKVLIVSTAEFGIAPNRLMRALQKCRIHVRMLTRDKKSEDVSVITVNISFGKKLLNVFRFFWERFVIWFYNGFSRKNLFAVSIANTGNDISCLPEVQEADIIHLHWINHGFLSLQDIRKLLALGKPVVWTLHDMWPCTSICHYARECDHFTRECGHCFYLRYPGVRDLSAKVWKKKTFLNDSGIYFVTVSSWLQEQVKRSSLTNRIKTTVIPNVLDLNLFYPRQKSGLKKKLKIGSGKKIVVFGAAKIDAPLKGLDLLKQALRELCREEKWKKELTVIIFGGVNRKAEEVLGGIECEVIYLGVVADPAKLADLYSIADVTVVPSRYETFGQVIIESMACGTPVVCFDNSGQRDIISHRQDGYLATSSSVSDFVKGIRWLLEEADYPEVAAKALEKVKKCYSEEVVARQYIEFYQRILKREDKFPVKMELL